MSFRNGRRYLSAFPLTAALLTRRERWAMRAFLWLICYLLFVVPHARGQVNVTFSGGNGSPFSITVLQPVVFTVDSLSPGLGAIFVLQNAGQPIPGYDFGGGGDLTYSINGGANQAISTSGSDNAFGVVSANDIVIYGAFVKVQTGDLLVLNSGTYISHVQPFTVPPAGSFTTFLVNANGAVISTFGVAVPEPGEVALIMIGSACGLAAAWRVRARSQLCFTRNGPGGCVRKGTGRRRGACSFAKILPYNYGRALAVT